MDREVWDREVWGREGTRREVLGREVSDGMEERQAWSASPLIGDVSFALSYDPASRSR